MTLVGNFQNSSRATQTIAQTSDCDVAKAQSLLLSNDYPKLVTSQELLSGSRLSFSATGTAEY